MSAGHLPQSSSSSRFTAGALHLEPIRRASRAIHRVLALRHNTVESHLAGVGEDGRAVALDVFVEPDAGAGLGRDRCERGLAHFQRIAPQVVAIQLDQVEGIEEGVASGSQTT